MIGLFLILVLFQGTLGDRKTKQIVNLVEIPVNAYPYYISVFVHLSFVQCGFALRYINIFFCPAFVTLPLSPSISGVEVAKIIAVFSQCSHKHYPNPFPNLLQLLDTLQSLLSQHTWFEVFSCFSARQNEP